MPEKPLSPFFCRENFVINQEQNLLSRNHLLYSYYVIKDWFFIHDIKKLELLSATPRATLTLLSHSPNFPRASITRYTHAKHKCTALDVKSNMFTQAALGSRQHWHSFINIGSKKS